MNPNLFRSLSWISVLLAVLSGLHAAQPPNIVIILADDLGYGDLGCYGHPTIRTPHLDQMAAEGLRFTDFYAGQSLCTPSRAALLTGRLAVRSGMAGGAGRHVLYPKDKGGLPKDEITIATALKSRKYVTGCIGKWHLGATPATLPTSHGFDSFFGLPYSNDMDTPSAEVRNADSMGQKPDFHNFNVPLMRNLEIIERPANQITLTRRYTDEAVAFLKANQRNPFFLYIAHTFPHVPLFASEPFKGRSARGLYGDTVEELDGSVGRVLETLRKEKLDRNTLVFFTSDNGPWLIRKQNGGSAGLLRDGKGGTWEGGYRVPAIAWWPGTIQPGVTHEVASAMDLFNTSLALAGAALPQDRPLDGFDMSPILLDNGKSRRDIQYYYYGDQAYAVRKGPFKAHFITHDGYARAKAEKHARPLLFNLLQDPSERTDLAEANPEVIAELTRIFEEHNVSVNRGETQF